LGIVEWAVYLLQTYYKGIDKAKKSLFEKVHFALFYTAILNALTSGVIYFGCRIETNRLWVKTEELELHHYIEVREEFERVQNKLAEIKSKNIDLLKNMSVSLDQSTEASKKSWEIDWTLNKYRVIHPLLIRRYDKLLVQIRFHELRMHFIRANGLPIKFKVSDYLYKCEQSVLSQCVHLRSFTWIVLMAVCNLIYFLMSMVVVGTGDMAGTEVGMTVIFYTFCGGMVLLSLVILHKVKWIFSEIMHKKLIDCTPIGNGAENQGCLSNVLVEDSVSKEFRQIDLFWFQNPHAIITAIQFMQFGFAMALSTCIIFWSDINNTTKYNYHSSLILMLVCVICMFLFLFLITRIVPRYTLCTNLGQLVNKNLLLPMVASYRLEETIKRRKRDMKELQEQQKFSVFNNSSKFGKKVIRRSSSFETSRYEQLADLVAKPTNSLPKISPDESRVRRKRTKALSDGVAIMRLMSSRALKLGDNEQSNDQSVAADSAGEIPSLCPARRKSRRKVVSEGVKMMRAGLEEEPYEQDLQIGHEKASSVGMKLSIDSVLENIPIMTKDPSDLNIAAGRSTYTYIHRSDENISQNIKSDFVKDAVYDIDSDAEDIPDIIQNGDRYKARKSAYQKLQDFFVSTKYCYLSGLLGNMVCFFLVNLRIEFLLVYGDGLQIKTWLFAKLNPSVFFWIELTWLLFFIVESAGMIYLFSKHSGKHPSVGMQLSGIFGFSLALTCAVLLLVAEAQRSAEYGRFGSRVQGGVGIIEPFTGMIALYFLRLPLGMKL